MHPTRRLKRHHLIFYLKVIDTSSGEVLGFLGDITTEGMMVMSKQPIESEREFDIEIRNQSGLSNARVVQCRARSLWNKSDVNPDYYATGFKLEDVSPESEVAIRALVREIGFDD